MPVKFRCYACNRLLGVSRSKVGAVVACPRCGAELIVPAPEPGDAEGAGATGAGVFPDVTGEGAAGELVPDLADLGIDLRPEDIMAEPGARGTVPRPSWAPLPPLPPPEPFPPLESIVAEDPPPEPVVAGIEVPPGAIRPGLAGRPRDVTIPRAAFVAWSLFALLALVLAFTAGIMVGRALARRERAGDAQANSVRFADSEIATTAGCFSLRSTEIA